MADFRLLNRGEIHLQESMVSNPREMIQAVRRFLQSLPNQIGRRGAILVPFEAVAHELRRGLLAQANGAELLAGVHFFTPASFASEICSRSGQPLRAGLEQTWPALLDVAFEQQSIKGLSYFDSRHLKEHRGYPQAIAETLVELDAHGLDSMRCQHLLQNSPDLGLPRLRDLCLMQHALEQHLAGVSPTIVTTPNLIRQAAQRYCTLAQSSQTFGPICAVLTQAKDLRFQPLIKAVDGHLVRLVGSANGPLPGSFEASLHAGVEDELEATVAWAEQEMIQHRTSLEQMAIICGQADLLLPVTRRLQQAFGREKVWLACNRPITDTSAGSLASSALACAEEHMPRQAVADFIFGSFEDLPYRLIVAQLSALGVLGGEKGCWILYQQRLEQIPQIHPLLRRALNSLIIFQQCVDSDKSFGQVFDSMKMVFLLLPDSPDRSSLLLGLEQSAQSLTPIQDQLNGRRGLRALHQSLMSMQVREGRFGLPLITVATLDSVAGLSFDTMRLIGLCEGSIPMISAENAILPDEERRTINQLLPSGRDLALPTQQDRIQAQIQAANSCVSAARLRLSVSCSHQQLDAQQLEPSTFLLELAARAQGQDGALPTMTQLSALSEKAIGDTRQWRRSMPLDLARQSLRLHRQAQNLAVPSGWLNPGSGSLGPVMPVVQRQWESRLNPEDGLLPLPLSFLPPGLRHERGLPISHLPELLRCPLRFFRERILKLQPTAAFPSSWQLDPLTSGNALHRISEKLFQTEQGRQLFCHRNPENLHDLTRAMVDEVFAEICSRYAMEGDRVRQRSRQDLMSSFESVLAYYASRVDIITVEKVEHRLGQGFSIPINTTEGPLYLKGQIDLLLRGQQGLLIHDIKSGKAHPFGPRSDFEIDRDLQPLLYDACLTEEVSEPVLEVGLIYPASRPRGAERLWTGDPLNAARRQAQQWLRVARLLLAAGVFVPCPESEDCSYCPFSATCDPAWLHRVREKIQAIGERARSGELLSPAETALMALRAMRQEDDHESPE